ncbi:cingulin-like isoform X2 [Zingiber officinale]|uniref:cingulin-like isoform X2 n=1 Tax=Zingiber officinale TaxID=94328 RepID=UPI001C4D26A8|nr:cingulin-like isoform X2 [Zingiber officinale]
MFKLHRHRSERFGEKVEFKLSNLQATKVPKVWDRLFLSIVSVETGKTISKTSKATVRNGNCQWTDAESIWVSQDNTSKELEESHFKIVVSPASARSVIIGEVTLNLADYISAGDAAPVFLPLKNCDSGTTLQVKVQCFPPKSKFRVGKSFKKASHVEDQNNNDDLDGKSDGSSNNQLSNTYPDEYGNRDTSFSASGSHRSSDSVDSLGRTYFSPKKSSNGVQYIGRQDSSGCQNANYGTVRVDEHLRSYQSSFNSRTSGSSVHTNQWEDTAAQASGSGVRMPSLRPSDSSKDLLEAAEEIEELRDEVKMWERHSRQLKLDIQSLKKEISEKSKNEAKLDEQILAANTEHDSLKLEVEQLKAALEESLSEQRDSVQKELEEELKFQKESNGNLARQLKQTQESNIELVTILQELEGITEKQRLEIANLSQRSSPNGQEVEDRSCKSLDEQMLSSRSSSGLEREVESLRNKVQELERDCAELTEENLDLLYKLKKLSKDAEKGGPSHDFMSERSHYQISTNKCEYEIVFLKSRICELEDELKRKEVTTATLSTKFEDLEKASADLAIELQHYKDETSGLEAKLREMHKEIREKNLELSNMHQKLKLNLENDLEGFDAVSMRVSDKVEPFSLSDMHDVTEDNYVADNDYAGDRNVSPVSTGLLSQKKSRHVVDDISRSFYEFEQLISSLHKEKRQLEEDLASQRKQNDEMSKILEDVQNDLKEITGSMEFHVSANKKLEKKTTGLESCKKELELQISEFEQENINLSERVSGLEAQLRYITNDKESKRLELEDTRSLLADLKYEVEKHKGENEVQKSEIKEKLLKTQKQLSEALEESDVLRRSNSKLQATIESLNEDCISLQKLTGDLKRQKVELHEHVTQLEVELHETRNKNLDFHEQVDILELKLSSLQKEIVSKEKLLLSQLEQNFQDVKEHEERIGKAHILLNKIEKEKTVEVKNFEKEIADLTAQMTSSQDEKAKLALAAVHEASVLRSDKSKLECNLQEMSSKAKMYEGDLQKLQKESKDKIQGLVDLHNASKQSEEMLMADIEHMKRVMEGVKSSEEKHRKMVSALELKHKASDYEKQELVEEISWLKVQLQKFSHLQNTMLDLKNSLDETNCEKQKLEEILKSLSEEHENLMSEKSSLTEKLSNMQRALCDAEDDRCSRIALQEKLLRMENDLSVKEASCAFEVELKNELNRVKRTNSEYQRKLQNLEQENVDLMKKVQSMETKMLRRLSQDQEMNSQVSNFHIEDSCISNEVDHHSDTLSLGSGQTEFLERNNMYKEEFGRVISQNQSNDIEALKKVINDNSETISSLELELRDMKERYLHMSLQYAEVEAQRGQLVMQLKSVKKEKSWFS